MFSGTAELFLIYFFSFSFVVSLLVSINGWLTAKRARIMERLHGIKLVEIKAREDVLARPFLDRTVGGVARWLVKTIGQITPQELRNIVEAKLERAGRPYNLKFGDFLTLQAILGTTVLVITLLFLKRFELSNKILLTSALTALAVVIPWFLLGKMITNRQNSIKRSLPDIMDLLVVSVEAGLAFEMALMKSVEKFKGVVADEFQRALGEMQLGKSRKDALRDMTNRVQIMELSSLVNAVIQSDQLGVGLSNVLRLQSDLIREKRQQYIEEQAMKAPVKMLFPMVFCIFPCIFIVILGPAILNILNILK